MAGPTRTGMGAGRVGTLEGQLLEPGLGSGIVQLGGRMPTYDDRPSGPQCEPPAPTSQKERILIDEKLNGFVVQVGCQQVVFESKEKLLSELARYLTNRKFVTEEYLKKGG